MSRLPISLIFIMLFSCAQGPGKLAENTEAAALAPAVQKKSNPVSSTEACVFAQLAYCSQPGRQSASHLSGFKVKWQPKAINSNHALVLNKDDQWVISIRGSLMDFSYDAFDNWINQDLNIISQVKWPYSRQENAQVSQGIYNSFQNLLQLQDVSTQLNLITFLKKNVGNNNSILITGHSLGGSLAYVLATYLQDQLKEFQLQWEVISFGAPAAGNKEFANDFNTRITKSLRVESAGDIAAFFPVSDIIHQFASQPGPLPATDSIKVMYRGIEVSLKKALEMSSLAMSLLEWKNGGVFTPAGNNTQKIQIPHANGPSGSSFENWLQAAKHQHGIAQYAKALEAPVLQCP